MALRSSLDYQAHPRAFTGRFLNKPKDHPYPDYRCFGLDHISSKYPDSQPPITFLENQYFADHFYVFSYSGWICAWYSGWRIVEETVLRSK